MIYYYSILQADHWDMLSKMVDDNYTEGSQPNDVVIFQLYLNQACRELKTTLNCSGRLIVYQLEPLVENHWWKTERIIKNLDGADEVWDYDLDNIEVLKSYGIEAKFKPIIYTDKLKIIENNNEPDLDVLFYGTPTPHRSKFMEDFVNNYSYYTEEQLQAMTGLNIVTAFGIKGKKLDEFISRSKIILNLNPYGGDTRQQQTRIFYPLINGKCVMSEKSKRNYFGGCIVEFTDFQDFGNKVIELVKTGGWKEYPSFSNNLSFSKERQDYQNFINRRPLI